MYNRAAKVWYNVKESIIYIGKRLPLHTYLQVIHSQILHSKLVPQKTVLRLGVYNHTVQIEQRCYAIAIIHKSFCFIKLYKIGYKGLKSLRMLQAGYANYHFDILYFLIAENRFFRTHGKHRGKNSLTFELIFRRTKRYINPYIYFRSKKALKRKIIYIRKNETRSAHERS